MMTCIAKEIVLTSRDTIDIAGKGNRRAHRHSDITNYICTEDVIEHMQFANIRFGPAGLKLTEVVKIYFL